MSPELSIAVSEAEKRFKQKGFVTERKRREPLLEGKPGSAWLAQDKQVYRNWTIGDRPELMVSLSKGSLAEYVAAEFVQLFDQWHGDLERLNALLD